MSVSSLNAILKMRFLVGYLGERAQYDWWPTAFYDTSSRLFMEPVFSRTTRLAQYHGVVEAARRLHDEHLSVGSYHLFRLPEEAEQDLHSLVQRLATEDLLLKEMNSKDAALGALKDTAGTVSVKSVGPAAIGSIGELGAPSTVRAIGAAYLSAFNYDAKIYPYLVD